MQEQALIPMKNQTVCIEEHIIVDGENLQYSMSNNLDDIEIAIYERTGQNLNLKKAYWQLNIKLFAGVKHQMIKHNVKYSMTIVTKKDEKVLVVNMHINDEWFIAGFSELKGSFQSWNIIQAMRLVEEILKEQSKKVVKRKTSKKNQKDSNLTIEKFVDDLDSLFKQRKNEELLSRDLIKNLLNLVEQYKDLNLCKEIKSYNFNENDFYIFMCICHLFINNNDDKIGFNDLKPFYENRIIVHEIMRAFSEGEHLLVKNNFIECNDNKDAYNSKTWRLSDNIKRDLFSISVSDENYENFKISKKNLIQYDSIRYKKMFYNNKENEAIRTLWTLPQQVYKVKQLSLNNIH